MMFSELQAVALTRDVGEYGLVSGDVGIIVYAHGGDAFEVEFARPDGQTVAVLTLRPGEFRALGADILHARRLPS